MHSLSTYIHTRIRTHVDIHTHSHIYIHTQTNNSLPPCVLCCEDSAALICSCESLLESSAVCDIIETKIIILDRLKCRSEAGSLSVSSEFGNMLLHVTCGRGRGGVGCPGEFFWARGDFCPGEVLRGLEGIFPRGFVRDSFSGGVLRGGVYPRGGLSGDFSATVVGGPAQVYTG